LLDPAPIQDLLDATWTRSMPAWATANRSLLANRYDPAPALIGGTGDDTFIVDNIGDVVIEVANGWIDTIFSSVGYTASANVENLTLTGTGAINGTGNNLANTITGNAAANVLNGGTGADTLIGGAGNDTYVIDNIGDVVIELAGEGVDTVQSSVTVTLFANVSECGLHCHLGRDLQ
jgi:trimeric autotransporter adhesin